MAERRSFLLRIDARILDQVKRWADDDLRSLNGQIEYLLREALRRSGRPAVGLEEPAPAEAGRAGLAEPGADED